MRDETKDSTEGTALPDEGNDLSHNKVAKSFPTPRPNGNGNGNSHPAFRNLASFVQHALTPGKQAPAPARPKKAGAEQPNRGPSFSSVVPPAHPEPTARPLAKAGNETPSGRISKSDGPLARTASPDDDTSTDAAKAADPDSASFIPRLIKLEAKLSSKEKCLFAAEKEVTTLKRLLEQSQRDLREKMAESENLLNRIETLESRKSGSGTGHDRDAGLATQQERNEELEKRIRNLEATKDQLCDERNELLERIGRLESQRAELRTEHELHLTESSQKLASERARVEELLKQVRQFESGQGDLRGKHETLLRQKAEEAAFEKARSEQLLEQVLILEAQKSELHDDRDALLSEGNGQLALEKARCQQLLARVDSLEAQHARLREEYDILLTESNEQIASGIARNEHLLETIQQRDSAQADLRAKHDALLRERSAQGAAGNARSEQLAKQIKILEAQQAELRKEYDQLLTESNEQFATERERSEQLLKQVAFLDSQKAELRGKYDSLLKNSSEQIATDKARSQQLFSQVESLESQQAELREKYELLLDQNNANIESVNSKTSELREKYESILEKSKEDTASEKNRSAKLLEQVKSLESQLADVRQQLDSREKGSSMNDQLLAELEDLKTQKAALETKGRENAAGVEEQIKARELEAEELKRAFKKSEQDFKKKIAALEASQRDAEKEFAATRKHLEKATAQKEDALQQALRRKESLEKALARKDSSGAAHARSGRGILLPLAACTSLGIALGTAAAAYFFVSRSPETIVSNLERPPLTQLTPPAANPVSPPPLAEPASDEPAIVAAVEPASAIVETVAMTIAPANPLPFDSAEPVESIASVPPADSPRSSEPFEPGDPQPADSIEPVESIASIPPAASPETSESLDSGATADPGELVDVSFANGRLQLQLPGDFDFKFENGQELVIVPSQSGPEGAAWLRVKLQEAVEDTTQWEDEGSTFVTALGRSQGKPMRTAGGKTYFWNADYQMEGDKMTRVRNRIVGFGNSVVLVSSGTVKGKEYAPESLRLAEAVPFIIGSLKEL